MSQLTPKKARQIASEENFRYFDTDFGVVSATFQFGEVGECFHVSDMKRFARFLERENISHYGETKHLVRHGVV